MLFDAQALRRVSFGLSVNCSHGLIEERVYRFVAEQENNRFVKCQDQPGRTFARVAPLFGFAREAPSQSLAAGPHLFVLVACATLLQTFSLFFVLLLTAGKSFPSTAGMASRYLLWGRSMGAASALLYAARYPTSDLCGLILDSPFCSFGRLARDLVTEGQVRRAPCTVRCVMCDV